MTSSSRKTWIVVFVQAMCWTAPAFANTFTVVNSGASAYVINGVNNPTLTLYRGRTYTFNISASGHPFWIKTNAVTGTGSAFNDGVTGNGTQVGTLTFAVPTNAPSTLFYICQFHAPMTGPINIQDSPQFGWWRFEEVGTNALDYSGRQLHAIVTNQNPGADNGSAGFSTDVPGALVVDGNLTNANARSYRFARAFFPITVTHPAAFRLTNNPASVTVEAFVKLTSAQLPMRLFDASSPGSPQPYTWLSPFFAAFDPQPLMAMTAQSDAATNFNTQFAAPIDPSPIAIGQWHHVAFVLETNRFRFYVDYQFAGLSSLGTYQPGTFTNVTSIGIGGIPDALGNTFNGLLDEVRVTAAALAPTQFLRVVGGLAPGFRAFAPSASNAVLTMVTESGVLYRVQATTNLLAAPQVWTNLGGVFTGSTYYTTLTNAGPPPAYFRALRNP